MTYLDLVESIVDPAASWIRRWPLWLKYVVVLVLIAVASGFIILRWGITHRLVTGVVTKTRGLQDRFPDPFVENLWFLPDGRLVKTLDRADRKVVISIWDPQTQRSEQRTFDTMAFVQAIRQEAESRRIRFTDTWWFQTAVVRDGSKMIVYLGGVLALFPHDWERGDPLEIAEIYSVNGSEATPPRLLTMTDDGLIALADARGRVEFRSQNDISNFFGVRQTKLQNPVIMKPLKNLLAVVSNVDGKVLVIDLNSGKDPPSHSYPPTALDQFTLAISPQGRLAIGRGDTEVRLSEPDGSAGNTLHAYGRVKVLSFFDEETVIAGGDFQNVYLLAQGKIPQDIASAPQGIHALAVNANRIAYAGNDGMTVLWYTKTRVPTRTGIITGAVFLGIALSMLPLYVSDAKRRRMARLLSPPPRVVVDDGALPVPQPPDALVKAFRNGECMLYAGAGVSAQADFPTWPTFVEDLTRWTIANEFTDARFGQSLMAAIDQGLYESVADNLVSIMRSRQQQFNDYLRQIFMKRTPLPASISLLKDLPFTGALTTNFDNLLERAFSGEESLPVYTPKDPEFLLECLHKRQFFLLKLYGMLERPDTVMIAPAQYDDAVKGNLLFSQFMETVLFSRTLLFIGSSLGGIEAYLKGISLPRQNLKTHYALVAVEGEAWQAKAQPLRERYGIEVLPYSPTAGHPQVQRFLEILNRRVRAETGSTRDETDTGTALNKVVLSDIGPFDHLELDLDPRWNILLGDNGVGKSSIIKAIACAILGSESASYAGRIIKAGKTQGVVTLVMGGNTYTTKLSRKNGEAKVESIPGRPFDGEGLLAVGFPPLRTVSWVRPRAPEAETKGRPTPDDLLPVITGETDPRLDKLKQWIVNVDYWIKDAHSRGKDASRYERLLKDFFDVVARLTKGVQIQFKEVKPQTNEVTIITDDGELPLEALSQGMTSLIGWVGILLQRLYEIYSSDRDPKLHYALVLMDEIDAHLHPAWQQSLIGELSKIFPNVQFIATTHSPLIVGGMNPQQIMRFARGEDQKVVAYKVEEQMMLGRADQILTSDLFGLKSTFAINADLELMRKEYHDLLRIERNETDEIRFQILREGLKTRLPTAGENPPERKAKQLIQALLTDEGDGKYENVNRELLEKAEQLLDEVGKRRK